SSSNCSPRGEVKLFDLKRRRTVLSLSAPAGDDRPDVLAFSPDGQHLAAANRHGRFITLWSAGKGRLLHDYNGHGGPVTDLAFSPDGQLLTSYSACNGVAKVWEPRTGKERLTVRGLPSFGHGPVGGGGLTFSPDGRRLISGTTPGGACYGYGYGAYGG